MSDYSRGHYRIERQVPNEMSRRNAVKNRAPWTNDDDEFIIEFWINDAYRDENEVALSLGRTIEACRARAHNLRVRLGINVTNTIEVEVSPGRLVAWDDDEPDSPTWYVR